MGCKSSIPQLDPDTYLLKDDHFNFQENLTELTNGSRRNCMQWIPTSTKIVGVVFICHGLAEHGLRYSKFASALTKRGFACFALDIQNHGLSVEVSTQSYSNYSRHD